MEKLPESIESYRFVSQRARMSGEFDSRKDSQSIKYKRRPQILIFEIEIEIFFFFQIRIQKSKIKIYQYIIHQNISKYIQSIVYENSEFDKVKMTTS